MSEQGGYCMVCNSYVTEFQTPYNVCFPRCHTDGPAVSADEALTAPTHSGPSVRTSWAPHGEQLSSANATPAFSMQEAQGGQVWGAHAPPAFSWAPDGEQLLSANATPAFSMQETQGEQLWATPASSWAPYGEQLSSANATPALSMQPQAAPQQGALAAHPAAKASSSRPKRAKPVPMAQKSPQAQRRQSQKDMSQRRRRHMAKQITELCRYNQGNGMKLPEGNRWNSAKVIKAWALKYGLSWDEWSDYFALAETSLDLDAYPQQVPAHYAVYYNPRTKEGLEALPRSWAALN